MLTLPIKKKWFDMIAIGEKKEEYRGIKPYYTRRLAKLWCDNYLMEKYDKNIHPQKFVKWLKLKGKIDFGEVKLKNGYSKTSPTLVIDSNLSIGTGNTKWGAVEGTPYFIFDIVFVIPINEGANK
jgi:hypothetical protein